jgi:hypothetical protein
MVKGTDQLARGCIPELCGIVSTCRQDPGTVAAELGLKDFILLGKGSEELPSSLKTPASKLSPTDARGLEVFSGQ